MSTITQNFPVTSAEYDILEKKFGRLAHYESWQLIKRNQNNNMIEEEEDIVQEIRIAMLNAGSYYKRQTFIEKSFLALKGRIKDPLMQRVLLQLKKLWKDRRRHGAGRQKFGPHQESVLEIMVNRYVPDEIRPRKDAALVFDPRFETYLKTNTWNRQKHLGKKVTREKSWRTGLVSLSEFDYLGS